MADVDWYELYHREPLRLRRLKKHLRKYKKYALPENHSGEIMLDLCCGAGEFTSLASAGNPASHVIGMDIYDKEFKNQNCANMAFVKCDAANISLKSDFCSHVFCFHSFHHLGERKRWQAVLHEVARVLKPGGMLHVIDHHNGFWMKTALLFFKSPFPLIIPWMRHFKIQLEEEEEILGYWLQNGRYLSLDAASAHLRRSRFRKSPFFFYACFVKQGGGN